MKQGEAILLTFTKVRGEAFERTVKVAADLSARLGVDLVSAMRQVGRSLQDPIQGLSLLRRAGIQFDDSQKDLVKNLVETGRVAQAQNVILTELERRYAGAAAAARNTLGGALAGLKNEFGDLFEGGSSGGGQLTGAINSLSEALSDPAFKKGMDFLVSSLVSLAGLSIKAVSAIGSLEAKLVAMAKSPNVQKFLQGLAQTGGPVGLAAGVAAGGLALAGGGADRGGQAGHGGSRIDFEAQFGSQEEAVDRITQIVIDARKIQLNADEEYFQQLDDLSKTSAETQATNYHKVFAAIQALQDTGRITAQDAAARQAEALDELLPEIDIAAIHAKLREIPKVADETAEILKGIWQGVGQSLQSTISDAIYNMKFSFKSLVDVARRAFADVAAAFVASGIQKLLKSLLSSSSSTSSSAAFGAGFLKALGFAAGGGDISGPTLVGEDGPEIVSPKSTSTVYNKRQMMGVGGANITYAPKFEYNVIERDDPQRTKQELIQYTETRIAQSQAEFNRTYERNTGRTLR